MKKSIFTLFSLAFLGLSNTYAQVGVGTTEPDDSAILELKSDDKGFLPPRMSTTERDAINGGDFEEGLIIYNTSVNCLQWFIGNNTWHDGCGDNPHQEYPEGTVFCESGPTEIVEVTNPVTEKTWMDRNLGASKAASSSTDADSYGDLYQWGRAADGHQCRDSDLHDGTTDLASTSAPNTGEDWDGRFITINSTPNDWLDTQDDNLWQGEDGVNNPCPTGYRLPTEAELNAERLSWVNSVINSTSDLDGAIASPLKLPAVGDRNRSTGSLFFVGSFGSYWSSTVSGTNARFLDFSSSFADMYPFNRASGTSVRCIKD